MLAALDVVRVVMTAGARSQHWLVATVAASRNEKNTRVRYIADPPAATRGLQPSRTIALVKPSASATKGAPVPVVLSDCRASVSSVRQRGFALWLELLLDGAWHA